MAKSGHLFVAAAGNSGSNNGSTPDYPSSFDLPNIISVASTNANDGLSSFSNYGSIDVDLGAPGEDIVSTYTITGKYELASGTSMAAPHVAGVAVLIASEHSGWGYAEIKNRILSTTRPLSSLSGKTVTGGILNAFNAVQEPTTAPAAPSALSATAVSDTEILLEWEDNSGNEQEFRIERNSEYLATAGANVTSYSDTGLAPDTSYSYQVIAYNEFGSSYSNMDTDTTFSASSVTEQTTVASSEIFGAGTVSGTYEDTAEADGVKVQTITERLSGRKVASVENQYVSRGWHNVDLSWDDPEMSVDIYRNGANIAPGVSGGTYTDANIGKGGAEYTYEVCEAGGTGKCSNVVVVSF
ncbi:S8 family serine peptidase [Vibrio sp. FJH11]